MNTIKFLEEVKRMSESDMDSALGELLIHDIYNCVDTNWSDETKIELVENWSKKHPVIIKEYNLEEKIALKIQDLYSHGYERKDMALYITAQSCIDLVSPLNNVDTKVVELLLYKFTYKGIDVKVINSEIDNGFIIGIKSNNKE